MIGFSDQKSSEFNADRAKQLAADAILFFGRRLVPLRKFKLGDGASKRPAVEDWTNHPGLTINEAELAIDAGCGLGLLVEPGEVVLDIDAPSAERPNKQGLESLAKIKAELGVDLLNLGCPMVESPTGGFHLFFKVPEGCQLAKQIEGFPGIDVLGPGRQVVFAGSRHWSGRGVYSWAVEDEGQNVPLPPVLLSKLTSRSESVGSCTAAGLLTIDDLRLALEHLDPRDYSERSAFLKLTGAVKHATGADPAAFEIFNDWATTDPEFASDTEGNWEIWDSLKLEKTSGRVATVGSLLQELRAKGQSAVADEIEARVKLAEAEIDFEPVAEPAKVERPKIELLIENVEDMVILPEEVPATLIDGIFRRGEIVNLIASAKVGKTWLAIDLAIRFSLGLPWLGFGTTGGRVLYIDNELSRDTFKFRADRVGSTVKGLYHKGRQIERPAENLDVINLRARRDLRDIVTLADVLKSQAGKYDLVVIDPLYKLLGKFEENSNEDITALYDSVLDIANGMNAAVICVHHTSKGDQSGKANVDVGAGASAMSRAADCHMSIRPHEEDGKFVLAADVRAFSGFDPFTIRKEGGLWFRDDAPAILGDPAQQRRREEADKRAERDAQTLALAVKHATINGESLKFSLTQLQKLLRDNDRSVNQDRLKDLCSMLVADNELVEVKSDNQRAKVAFVASESLLLRGDPNGRSCSEVLARLREIIQNEGL